MTSGTEGKPKPSMKTIDKPDYTKKLSRKTRALAAICIIAFVLIALIIIKKHNVDSVRELMDDPIPADSVQLVNHTKIDQPTFESDYSADSWFQRFSSNKVAFDKIYNNDWIDVTGVIGSIENPFDCPSLSLEIEGSHLLRKIRCTNCNSTKNKWPKEILNIKVGQTIHIQGNYAGTLSSEYEMYLTKCEIVN